MFEERRRWVIEVVYGAESEVYGGVDKRDALVGCAEELEAVVRVFVVAECAGEWIVLRECL